MFVDELNCDRKTESEYETIFKDLVTQNRIRQMHYYTVRYAIEQTKVCIFYKT